MTEATYKGSCLCEGVRFTVTGTAEKVFACYCADCSKNAGGPYQVVSFFFHILQKNASTRQTLMRMKIAKYPKNAVSVTAGSELLAKFVVTKTSSGSEKDKIFCKICACTLWTVPMHTGGTHYIVRTSLIEDGYSALRNIIVSQLTFYRLNTEGFEPVAEFFSSMRPKWLPALEGVKCFDTMPGK